MDYDEGIYIRRALYTLEGNGPQDPASRFDHGQGTNSSYDHPHFGQIFLAGILGAVGYPDSLQTSTTIQSIEMLYAVPRILMGVLSVVDTFLVYLIANRYYNNRYVAFGSSILFAVMPLTWMTRRIYLDSILLPFLLLSILLGVYYNKRGKTQNGNKNLVLILLSGICLGLAIYTKVPAIAMIPLVGTLIFFANGPDRSAVGTLEYLKNRCGKKNLKILGIWLIPVVTIPLLWPAYAISIGQFDEWMQGVLWQGGGRLLFESTGEVDTSSHTVQSELGRIYHMDPVLVVLGILGTIFAAVRRDYLILLWVIPFFILVILIHWVYYFHFIMLLPAFCIASASLIVLGPARTTIKKRTATFLSLGMISVIVLFGMINTLILVGSNFSLSQFVITSFIAEYVDNNQSSKNDGDTTIISSPDSAWIFKYIFDKENALTPRDSEHMLTKKVLLVTDENYLYVVNQREVEDERQVQKIQSIYDNSVILAAFEPAFKENMLHYPLNYNINSCTIGLGEVRTTVN